MARWSKLTRIIRDKRDDVTLRTRSDLERYVVKMKGQHRDKSAQWAAVARMMLEGADAERVTQQVETALFFDARLDIELAQSQKRKA